MEVPAKILFIPFLIIGPLALVWGLYNAAHDSTREWRPLPAEVVGQERFWTTMTVGRDGRKRVEKVRVELRYELDGTAGEWQVEQGLATPLAKTAIGGTTTIYYDARDPSDLRVEPGSAGSGLFAAFAGLFITGAGVGCLAFLRARRRRRSPL